MGARVRSAFGWAGLAALVAGVALLYPDYERFAEETQGVSEDLRPLLMAALALGGTAVCTVVARAFIFQPDGEDAPDRWRIRAALAVRVAAAALGALLVWWTLPTRHMALTLVNDGYRMYPVPLFALWGGVCAVALGLLLSVFGPWRLRARPWQGPAAGALAGAAAASLVWAGVPLARPLLTLEHTVAAGGEGAPVPEEVARVGWTWEPGSPVLGVEAGPRGPVVRHADGFTALDGASGEELWTYRLRYGREVETGVFRGVPERAFLLHRQDPSTGTRTLVVLDTATGEVVHDAPMPEPDPEDPIRVGHLGADVRVRVVRADGRATVVAHSPDSTGELWEHTVQDEAPGRWCHWNGDEGMVVHGDRVLIARHGMDEEGLVEEGGSLYPPSEVPEGAVRSVTALDAATGEQVWRHEAPARNRYDDHPPVTGGAPQQEGARTVVVDLDAVFDASTGEELPLLPGTDTEAGRAWIAADTRGAVVLRRSGDGGAPVELLRTGTDGGVVQRTRVHGLPADTAVERAVPLARTAVLPSPEAAGAPRDRAVTLVPLGGTVAAGEAEEIRFEGERVPGDGPGDRPPAHRVVAVPGAVVSFIDGAATPAPLHGLVP
ncbi:PQQ-binding-like beta-propeller repeat protein [Nocardiopsis sp. NPDC057823]|uniref:outer membrane protein assembly factor BamB family protein n=1 Tax=Nocardiopsis sp. NPDC057823 TaxID=3346256 RepID=UPI0036706780